MPARRLPWVKLWRELMESEKIRQLSDGQYRTWTYCLMAGSQQLQRWRFDSLEHVAYVTRRPMKDVRVLADKRFLDVRDDGVWIHDAAVYQDVSPSDVARERSAKAPRIPPPNGRPMLGEGSAKALPNAPPTVEQRSLEKEKEIEKEIESSVPSERVAGATPPVARLLKMVGEPVPKPAPKPTAVGCLLDKIRALDASLEVYGDHGFTGAKLKANPTADLDLVAEAYVSFRHGEWQGSKMLRESGSLAWVIGDVGGYVGWRDAKGKPKGSEVRADMLRKFAHLDNTA